jgi:lipopolysaccharide assembly protein A
MTSPGHPGSAPAGHRRRITARQIFALAVLALVVIFIVQNRSTVEVQLFTVTVSSPLWLLLIIMVGLGMLTAFLLTRRRH